MTGFEIEGSPRWRNYVMESGPRLQTFWRAHFQAERNVLFVLGKGFDRRMCLGLQSLMDAGGTGNRDVVAIHFDEGASSPSKTYWQDVNTNWAELQGMVEGKGVLTTKPLKMWSDDGRRIGSRNAARLFSDLHEFKGYTDIMLDISALPRGVYFPLIAKILYILDEGVADKGSKQPNFHVVVAENAKLDRRIQDEGVDDTATYVHSFGGDLEMEATADRPKVWIPVLGERQATQLVRVYELVKPDEIAPVLPSPSLNPRRSDDLLLEYREILFDRLKVEASNFIFASERNPFEVYRQIRRAVLHYNNALRPLGGCKTVLSAFTTKLLSVGALLVAYELKRAKASVGLAHVECQGYTIEGGTQGDEANAGSELFGLWLWGECHEP
ncbi:MAG: hypothetical protein HYU64_13925 [Armatimonadetes bacterium]|nr:hypothetical protein [Armatimonadota bacterium]